MKTEQVKEFVINVVVPYISDKPEWQKATADEREKAINELSKNLFGYVSARVSFVLSILRTKSL